MRKALVIVAAVWLLGFGALAVPPAYAAAKDAITNVFITNTPDNPVPVNGTVTVANPTPVATSPVRVQQAFETQPITKQNPFANGTLYRVPADKVLTVEFFQAHWAFEGVNLRQAVIRSSPTCFFTQENDPTINRAQVFFPEIEIGDLTNAAGGPTTLLVPPGGCLTYTVGAMPSDIGDNTTIYVYGAFTGYLTDAPAA